YLAALGEAIGRAIDKGMQDGLAAGIDHGKLGRGLVDVATYNPSAEANYVSAVNALPEVSEANQLQSLPEQLMLPIHRSEEQVVIGETSLSFSLDLSAENLVGAASTSGVLPLPCQLLLLKPTPFRLNRHLIMRWWIRWLRPTPLLPIRSYLRRKPWRLRQRTL
nr:hypothetical protein [Tanacetum cinerariifolium]